MAGPIRFRQNVIFAIILAIPTLWLIRIGFMAVLTGNNLDELDKIQQSQLDMNNNIKSLSDNSDSHSNKIHEQPVLEQPNKETLQLEERMREQAQEELQKKEEELHVLKGHEVQANAMNLQELVNPFHDHVIQNNVLEGETLPPIKIDPNAPGEMGKAVNINETKLSPEEKKKFDDGWQRNSFNQYASDMIAIHRSLPDVRPEECKSLQYHTDLPDTSVVVIFYNEAWSVLLRTVHSVIDRSPPHLLREVILVDDFSDFDHLKQQLQDYADTEPKVKLVRAKKREGLIRARLLGASVAQGDVITFLDSHCEATEGWLEPLLDCIRRDESHVVCPMIDDIQDTTLEYVIHNSSSPMFIGGFDWNLIFRWQRVPDREKKRWKSPVDPVRSPTMAGGLFAISKAYFEKLGAYDPGMDIWGGENLEMSFRIWMCGGTLEIIPCSHVGHIFRHRFPYTLNTGVNVFKKNSIRLAEVWMDEYKTYYYERYNFKLGDYGDVTSRKKLREDLHCKTFDWYLNNIFPELFNPSEAVASGQVRSEHLFSDQGMCLDGNKHNKGNDQIFGHPCHEKGSQHWMLSLKGEVRRCEDCLDYAGQFVMINNCHGKKGNQNWIYRPDNTLCHKSTGLCLELSINGKKIRMKPCKASDRQIWNWKRKSEDTQKVDVR